MLKNITLICVIIFLGFIPKANAAGNNCPNIDTSRAASIIISPERPLIEKDIYGYYLNFDISIKNQTKHVLQLSSIETAVMDDKGKLILWKVMNNDGRSSEVALLGNTIIKPGETVSILNPFHSFQPDVAIASLKYGFFFDYADSQAQIENNKKRLPIDYDAASVKVITPRVYIARNEYNLPLKGKLIVWDGHDFYSHNRRTASETTDKQVKKFPVNESRYAYDLLSVDAKGNMYSGTPFKKQDWYVFGKPVFVPADGKVIEVKNDIPDNEFSGKSILSPKGASVSDPIGKGNYVIIQHANGEYSELLNMEKGSIHLRPGELVKAGEQVGTVGFSGNVQYPQLHYMVTNGATELVAEGLPNYFNNYKLYRGENVVSIKRSRVDSGDIVESER